LDPSASIKHSRARDFGFLDFLKTLLRLLLDGRKPPQELLLPVLICSRCLGMPDHTIAVPRMSNPDQDMGNLEGLDVNSEQQHRITRGGIDLTMSHL
jgi:hypothetical protein